MMVVTVCGVVLGGQRGAECRNDGQHPTLSPAVPYLDMTHSERGGGEGGEKNEGRGGEGGKDEHVHVSTS